MGTGLSVETVRIIRFMLWTRLHCNIGWCYESLVVKTIPRSLCWVTD